MAAMSQLQDTQRRHFGLGFFRWKNGWIVDGVFPWVFRPQCWSSNWFHWDSFDEELEKMPGGVVKVLAKHGPEAAELIH